MNYAKAFLGGRLTKDVETIETSKGKTCYSFSVACNVPEALFMDCYAYGSTGETIEKYFKKGYPIFVEGRLKEKKNDKGKYVFMIVDNFTFVGGKTNESDANNEK